MEKEEITIPHISLVWSDWIDWNDLEKDARIPGAIRVPNEQPGVYEVKNKNSDERLTIGKASNLRFRIKQGLVKGKSDHSSGDKIRQFENVAQLVVRWAITDRPSAVEEELHRKYEAQYGHLPKYVDHT